MIDPTSTLYDLASELQDSDPGPALIGNITTSNFTTPPDLNLLGWGSATAGPVTPGNINQVQAFCGTIVNVNRGPSGNMFGNPLEELMSSPSGYWRVTLYINNGTTGVGESHVLSSTASFTAVKAAALQLAKIRSALLGNNTSGLISTSVKAPPSPMIEFIRIADALNPRNALTFAVTDPDSAFGYSSITTNSAEELHRAFALRLPGTTPRGPAAARRRTT